MYGGLLYLYLQLLDLEEETDSEEQIPHTTKQRPHTAIARTTTPVNIRGRYNL